MVPIDIDKVEKARKQDRNAFSELIQERKDDIYRLAYAYVKNSEDALDIFQDTVFKALISIKKLKNPEFFNTWITRIAINCSIDFLKKKNKISSKEIKTWMSEEANDFLDDRDEPLDAVLNIDLFNAIDKLDANHKTIIILKYFQDLTLTQISEILLCPVGTVKTRLNRALRFLRVELKEVAQ